VVLEGLFYYRLEMGAGLYFQQLTAISNRWHCRLEIRFPFAQMACIGEKVRNQLARLRADFQVPFAAGRSFQRLLYVKQKQAMVARVGLNFYGTAVSKCEFGQGLQCDGGHKPSATKEAALVVG
jgi:hypothetical protein